MGVVRSDWQLLRKGTPQGSVMGPFAYNAHTNDLILVLADMCEIVNYADDNTACCYDTSIQGVLKKLNNVVSKMLIRGREHKRSYEYRKSYVARKCSLCTTRHVRGEHKRS